MAKTSDLEAALMRNPFFAKQLADQCAKPTRKVRRSPAPLPVTTLPLPSWDGQTLSLPLPLPHRQLHKNGGTSKNYGWRAKLARECKGAAFFLANMFKPADVEWKAARVDLEFWTANKLDDDGAFHWVFNYRDGIAKALGCDDQHFTCGSVVQHVGKLSEGKRMVILKITRIS